MKGRTLKVAGVCMVLCGAIVVAGCTGTTVEGQQGEGFLPGEGFAAVPGLKGGHDAFGPYDPVEGWPKPLAESLPDHEGWTWSQATDVFVETPDRVLVAQKGELPVLPDISRTWLPEIGPGIKFPVGGGTPLRESSSATPSHGIGNPDGRNGRPGIDWRWEHVIVAFDAEGNMTEDWSQWDDMWGRPHDIEISPYDPERHIWIVDADDHKVLKFSNDGKELLMTLGTPDEPGTDDTHFRRPTFLAFMDAETFYLADGYDNTRVIKYDMEGNILAQWGEEGAPGRNETRPGYWNNVHGIAVNPETRLVYVNDRNNGRVQVFDENGVFVDAWSFGPRPPMNIHDIYMGDDGILWAADQGGSKLLGYDADGNFVYSWGTFGTCQGCMWGVHGFHTDMEGNLYTSEVRTGRVQKYTPREGANPAFLVGKPWPRVW